MGKILTEISEGELLDKITILEIKLNEIKNQSLIKEVQKEYEILTKIRDKNIKENKIIDDLFVKLKKVNQKIWDIENINLAIPLYYIYIYLIRVVPDLSFHAGNGFPICLIPDKSCKSAGISGVSGSGYPTRPYFFNINIICQY